MRKSTFAAISVLIAFGACAAATQDENGIVPKYWLKFDNNGNSSGESESKLNGTADDYVVNRYGRGLKNHAPYTGGNGYLGGIEFGTGAWTLSLAAKADGTDKGILWSLGNKTCSDGLALYYKADGAVALGTWSNGAAISELVSAAVSGATTKYHSYIVTADPAATTITLYIDGVKAGESTSFAGNPSDWNFQLGGIHGGQGETTLVKITSEDQVFDDWRFYQSALTAAQIAAVAQLYPLATDGFTVWTDLASHVSDGVLNIPAGETIILTGDNQIDGSFTVTGGGCLVVHDGSLDFTYGWKNGNACMTGFTGTLVAGSNGALKAKLSIDEERTWNGVDPFGTACTLRLEGGVIDGYYCLYNVTLNNPIEVAGGFSSALNSSYENGANVTLKGALTGSGTLSFTSANRQLKFNNDCSGFTGKLVGKASGNWAGVLLQDAACGSAAAAWELKTGTKSITVEVPADSTVGYGQLTITNAASVAVTNTGVTLAIGDRGGESVLDVPFTDKAVTIRQTGDGTLTLGPKFKAVSGTVIEAVTGKFTVLEGADMTGVTITYALEDDGTTLNIPADTRLFYVGTIPAKVTGSGTLVIAGEVTVSYKITDAANTTDTQNPFKDFTGDIELVPGGVLVYRPYTDGVCLEPNSPLGTGKVIFKGGALAGFSGAQARNNFTFFNAIEIVEGTTSRLRNIYVRSGACCNLKLEGKVTGKGTLEIEHPWQSGRVMRFRGDMSEFEGTFKLLSGGAYTVTGEATLGARTVWDCGVCDNLRFESAANSPVRLGAVKYDARTNGRLDFSNSGITVEIGGVSVDSTIASPFIGNAITLKRVGTETLTLMSTATMPEGSTVSNDNAAAVKALNDAETRNGWWKNVTRVMTAEDGTVTGIVYSTEFKKYGLIVVVR